MNQYVAAAIVIAVLLSPWWVPRLRIWSRCRCGARYCTGCGRRG